MKFLLSSCRGALPEGGASLRRELVAKWAKGLGRGFLD